MKKRKPGPQKRRTGATTSEILARQFQAAPTVNVRFVSDVSITPSREAYEGALARVISTRKTLAQRIVRATRLAYYRTWRSLDRAWVRRCKVDKCMTPEEIAAAEARDTELTLIIMQIEAD